MHQCLERISQQLVSCCTWALALTALCFLVWALQVVNIIPLTPMALIPSEELEKKNNPLLRYEVYCHRHICTVHPFSLSFPFLQVHPFFETLVIPTFVCLLPFFPCSLLSQLRDFWQFLLIHHPGNLFLYCKLAVEEEEPSLFCADMLTRPFYV